MFGFLAFAVSLTPCRQWYVTQEKPCCYQQGRKVIGSPGRQIPMRFITRYHRQATNPHDVFTPTLPALHQPSIGHLYFSRTIADIVTQDLMKGYISRDHGVVVLSKKGAFPGTGI